MLTFFLDSMQDIFQYYEHYLVGVKAIGGHQFDFSMFNEFCSCNLQQKELMFTIRWWREAKALAITWVVCGFS